LARPGLESKADGKAVSLLPAQHWARPPWRGANRLRWRTPSLIRRSAFGR